MSDEEVLEANLGDQEIDLPISALTGAEVDETFGLPVVNTTGVSNEEVFEALQRENGQIMAQLGVWAQSLQASQFGQGGASRSGGIMARDAYLTPDKIYDQIVTAQKAAEDDDVTGGYIEATESLAFSSVSMFAEDPDEQDIYNQVVGDLELDARLREIWREVVTYSQVYMAVWWQKKTYKVKRKPTKGGAQRRKTYTLDVPVAMELLDPLKVVPVQVGHYGGARLAYCASRGEAENITNVLENKKGATDKFVKAMIEGPYEASRDEQKALKEAGFPATNLFLFKEGVVFRHTLTKPNYARWANVRMKSIFELLDAKRQLRQMDRAYLLGGTNFLVVVTKGTDALPASPAEVDNLRTQVRTVHRLPVLVGDHRLKVEIVTPKMDNTLKAERYNTIDSRITARLYQIFALGNYSAGASGDDSVKLVKVIARGMESRRHMIRRTLEKYIFDEMYRRNERTLKTRPHLQFHPQSIALDFDSALASFLLDLRASREISRETLLSQFDLSQSHEALMLQREEEEFDDIFQTLAPPGSPGTAVNPRRDNGGGNRNGGGAAPGTGQGQPARNPRRRSDRGRDLPEIESNLQVVGADGEVVELTAEQIELIEKVVENA